MHDIKDILKTLLWALSRVGKIDSIKAREQVLGRDYMWWLCDDATLKFIKLLRKARGGTPFSISCSNVQTQLISTSTGFRIHENIELLEETDQHRDEQGSINNLIFCNWTTSRSWVQPPKYYLGLKTVCFPARSHCYIHKFISIKSRYLDLNLDNPVVLSGEVFVYSCLCDSTSVCNLITQCIVFRLSLGSIIIKSTC